MGVQGGMELPADPERRPGGHGGAVCRLQSLRALGIANCGRDRWGGVHSRQQDDDQVGCSIVKRKYAASRRGDAPDNFPHYFFRGK